MHLQYKLITIYFYEMWEILTYPHPRAAGNVAKAENHIIFNQFAQAFKNNNKQGFYI